MTARARPRAHGGLAACLTLLAMALLLASCGTGRAGNADTNYQVPPGWHDASPPSKGAIVSYAVSRDVPGLIVACTAERTGHVSADLGIGPATFWRTRDSGARWQRLDVPPLTDGCELAFPAGGHGTLLALGGASLQVSHDAGSTWSTIERGDGYDLSARFELLTRGVYRDGNLYTPGQTDTPASISASATATAASLAPTPDITPQTRDRVSPAFSVSADDSRTWTPIETALDPLVAQGYAPLAIAADYSAPDAWFRLLGPSYGGAEQAQAVLEHSTDGGHSWVSLGKVGPVGMYYEGRSATLATSPVHPATLCAAFAPEVYEQGASSASTGGSILPAPAGPPPPVPHDLALAASPDGGHTWHETTLARARRQYSSLLPPGVTLDAGGSCYVADNVAQVIGAPPAAIWRADPSGKPGQARAIAQIQGQAVSFLTVASDSSGAERLLALATTYHPLEPIICQGDVCPPEPPLPVPHLIWRPLP